MFQELLDGNARQQDQDDVTQYSEIMGIGVQLLYIRWPKRNSKICSKYLLSWVSRGFFITASLMSSSKALCAYTQTNAMLHLHHATVLHSFNMLCLLYTIPTSISCSPARPAMCQHIESKNIHFPSSSLWIASRNAFQQDSKMLCPIQKHRSSGAIRYGRVPARKLRIIMSVLMVLSA